MAEVRIANRFQDDLDMVLSDKVLLDILNTVELLAIIPSLGSTNVPRSIAAEFGAGVRKIPVSPFDIITIYHPDKDLVEVAGLVHQRAAW
ncbi:hypothetical protein GMI69_03620 [Eggerthellaceae bacterium zg-887]|uniref:hypothetical protein n=1 Tax=Xiamenia xianingshaonis TaxID=2682776 RepID=UPI001408EA3B|nr:hypothetical protein [Xiamenia xianingshaonis]NHM15761.1 hypothetical protein [Xiamenia xianingshaonis]